MLELTVDQKMFNDRADLVAATEAQIESAMTMALRKTGERISVHVRRKVATDVGVPQHALNGRIRLSKIGPGTEQLKVWFGTWNIDARNLGNIVQNKLGVRVGKMSFRGAFSATMKSGKEGVWMRLYSKHYNPKIYPAGYDHRLYAIPKNSGRLPVIAAAIRIDEAVKNVFENNHDFYGREFEKAMLAALNYQVNVKGRRA